MIQASQFINIVLVETSHPGNIGSTARAMKNMGLNRLSLVRPKKFPHADAKALAGNAQDILEQANLFDSVTDAIGESKYVLATSARERSIDWPIVNVRDGSAKLHALALEGTETSIIFGKEDSGLSNEELQLANEHLIIPTDQDYPVLNLAMSVQLVCYELFMNASEGMAYEWQDFPVYTQKELDNLIEHFCSTSFDLGLIDKNNPKQIITRIERMFRRLYPDKMEGNFLRGFLTAVNKKIK